MLIYDDQLGDGWQDWSWGTQRFQPPRPGPCGQGGHFSCARRQPGAVPAPRHLRHGRLRDAPGVRLRRHDDARLPGGRRRLSSLPYVTLTPYLHPGPGGPPRLAAGPHPAGRPGRAARRAGDQRDRLPAGSQRAPQPLVVDDVSLLPDLSLPPAPTAATVAVTVNAAAGRHPISPLIYGMAFAPDGLSDGPAPARQPLGRQRQEPLQLGAGQRRQRRLGLGLPQPARRRRRPSRPARPPRPTPSSGPNKARGAATLLTVPTLGWVARDADNGHASVNVPASGGPGAGRARTAPSPATTPPTTAPAPASAPSPARTRRSRTARRWPAAWSIRTSGCTT